MAISHHNYSLLYLTASLAWTLFPAHHQSKIMCRYGTDVS